MQKEKEVTFLMPCLNEEKTIEESIKMAKKFINKNNIDAEILIIDNGSTDNSSNIAKKNNARVVLETKKGYGSALRRGIFEAQGKYIIMGDCDTTYDFEHVEEFLQKLREEYDLVMGNRFKGGIQKGAMPISHKIGVKFLSFIAKKKFKVEINDFHCGIRGINTKTAKELQFKSEGMEFATEMIYQFRANNKKIIEIPTKLYKCKNTERKPHLKAINDGIRHIKFIIESTSTKQKQKNTQKQ